MEYTEERSFIVTVSSKDRNIGLFPSPSSYQVPLPEIRNIVKVELIGGIIPDKLNVTYEPYLVLSVDEFKHRSLIASDETIENGFAILQMTPPVSAGKFINLDMSLSEELIHQVVEPFTINKMTIKIKKSDGTLFNFGTDTEPFDATLQNTFIFRITTKIPKTSIAQRFTY